MLCFLYFIVCPSLCLLFVYPFALYFNNFAPLWDSLSVLSLYIIWIYILYMDRKVAFSGFRGPKNRKSWMGGGFVKKKNVTKNIKKYYVCCASRQHCSLCLIGPGQFAFYWFTAHQSFFRTKSLNTFCIYARVCM